MLETRQHRRNMLLPRPSNMSSPKQHPVKPGQLHFRPVLFEEQTAMGEAEVCLMAVYAITSSSSMSRIGFFRVSYARCQRYRLVSHRGLSTTYGQVDTVPSLDKVINNSSFPEAESWRAYIDKAVVAPAWYKHSTNPAHKDSAPNRQPGLHQIS